MTRLLCHTSLKIDGQTCESSPIHHHKVWTKPPFHLLPNKHDIQSQVEVTILTTRCSRVFASRIQRNWSAHPPPLFVFRCPHRKISITFRLGAPILLSLIYVLHCRNTETQKEHRVDNIAVPCEFEKGGLTCETSPIPPHKVWTKPSFRLLPNKHEIQLPEAQRT